MISSAFIVPDEITRKIKTKSVFCNTGYLRKAWVQPVQGFSKAHALPMAKTHCESETPSRQDG
jgi:hypothetical protein